jgi:hypothetical protein
MTKDQFSSSSPEKQPFSSAEQGKERRSEMVSLSPIGEMIASFKKRIQKASLEQHISIVEYEWWITEGVDTIMRDIPDPQKAMEAITELMNAFEMNIVLNKEKMMVIQQAERRMQEGNFSEEERLLWKQKIESIQDQYHQRKIGLRESVQQLHLLVSALTEQAKKNKGTNKLYTDIQQICNTSDMQMLPVLDAFIRGTKNIQPLSGQEKIEWIYKLRQLLEQEFHSFIQTYSTFAHTANVAQKWDRASTTAAKLKVLLQAHRTMRRGKETREGEFEIIRLLIRQQEFTRAEQQLQHLKTKIHPDTYHFFFHREEETLRHIKTLQQQLLLMATRFEEARQFSQAIDALHKAQESTDRHDIPILQQHILRVQQRQEAQKLLVQAERLSALGQKEESQQYQEQAKQLDPLITLPVSQQEKHPESSQQQGIEEIKKQLQNRKEWKVLQEESQMIERVQSKLEQEGISTLTKESGSAIKRAEQQVQTEEEKEYIAQKIQKNTVSLHEQTVIKQESMIQMIIEKENVEDQVHSVLQDMKEGKRKAQTMSFKKSEQSIDPLSMTAVADLHRRKIATFILQRAKEIGEKHGIRIELSSDDIRRLLQQAA